MIHPLSQLSNKADPKSNIKKGKVSQGASSSILLGIVGDLPKYTFQRQVVVYRISKLPTIKSFENQN